MGLKLPHFEGLKALNQPQPGSKPQAKVWSDGIRVQIVWKFTLRAWAIFLELDARSPHGNIARCQCTSDGRGSQATLPDVEISKPML